MREFGILFGISSGLMAWLTWNQPSALVSLARMIERSSAWCIRKIRVRAWAKRDSDIAYQKSKNWYEQYGSTEIAQNRVVRNLTAFGIPRVSTLVSIESSPVSASVMGIAAEG